VSSDFRAAQPHHFQKKGPPLRAGIFGGDGLQLVEPYASERAPPSRGNGASAPGGDTRPACPSLQGRHALGNSCAVRGVHTSPDDRGRSSPPKMARQRPSKRPALRGGDSTSRKPIRPTPAAKPHPVRWGRAAPLVRCGVEPTARAGSFEATTSRAADMRAAFPHRAPPRPRLPYLRSSPGEESPVGAGGVVVSSPEAMTASSFNNRGAGLDAYCARQNRVIGGMSFALLAAISPVAQTHRRDSPPILAFRRKAPRPQMQSIRSSSSPY